MNEKRKVLIDTSPLGNAHAIRGVGVYTSCLLAELEKRDEVEISRHHSKKITPDLVHYPFFDLFFPTLPLFRKYKTVVTVHDVIPLRYPEFYRPGKRGRLHFYRQKFALQHVQAILTDSEASKKDIQFFFKVPAEKIHVIYLAGNPDIHRVSQKKIDEVSDELHLPKKYILYVGDINYNKNLPQLMKAMKFLPDDLHLVCVGKNFYPHPIIEWKWIDTQIALSNVASRVHFVTDIGKDGTEKLSALYSGASAYVQPSVFEGFGLPLLEAMQCETPVVSTHTSSLIEVGGEHVRFVETDAQAIADGVQDVLSWPAEHRVQVVKSAFQWSQTFSWQKAADETLRIYQSI